MRLLLLSSVLTAAAFAAPTTTAPVTFNKDVAAILQKNCQGCHRPGEAAPMSFTSYKEARPWAKAIKGAVLSKKMPPWLADPHYGQFSNERKLTDDEVQKLVAWADSGAPEGKAKDAPKPVAWLQGWNIQKPDQVFEMPQTFEVPASGTVEYNYVILPTGFTKDTWVQEAEVRPGNRAVVHHVIAFVRPPGSKWLQGAPVGEPFIPQRQQRSARRTENSEDGGNSMAGVELVVGYAPGLQEQKFVPGQAKLIPAGSDIVLQLHYTANGKAATDRTAIGLVFAKEEPKQRIVTMNATQARFAIPAGDPNYEVKSQITLQDDSQLVWLMPHMHLRGKDFIYTAVYPTGEREVLLNVPKYDFNWQLSYDEAKPLVLPKGTRLECVAHFDNSPNNKYNPDPTKEVRWGDQSWEEMMIGWFGVAIDAKADPMRLYMGDKAVKKTPASKPTD